jgi:hypothetical protein
MIRRCLVLERLTTALIVESQNALAERAFWLADVGQRGYAAWSLSSVRCLSFPLLLSAFPDGGDGEVLDQL